VGSAAPASEGVRERRMPGGGRRHRAIGHRTRGVGTVRWAPSGSWSPPRRGAGTRGGGPRRCSSPRRRVPGPPGAVVRMQSVTAAVVSRRSRRRGSSGGAPGSRSTTDAVGGGRRWALPPRPRRPTVPRIQDIMRRDRPAIAVTIVAAATSIAASGVLHRHAAPRRFGRGPRLRGLARGHPPRGVVRDRDATRRDARANRGRARSVPLPGDDGGGVFGAQWERLRPEASPRAGGSGVRARKAAS